jgi:uncharacterized protein YbaR (Trm112 family)
MLNEELLSILVCPETKQKLTLSTEKELATFNEAFKLNLVKDVNGQLFKGEYENLLIRSDKQVGYIINNEIAIILSSQQIDLSDIIK